MSSTSLLLQLIVILATARSCGWLLRFLGQPGVVGEMVAGLLLGPLIFGALFPALQAQLFSKDSLAGLTSLSTLGLVLSMFLVGLELRAHEGVRAQIKAAGYVGIFSVSVPLALGIAIAPFLYPTLAPHGVGFWPFAFFIASALSITAFPVMARILKDRSLTQTRVGQLSLSAAAVVDLFTWILLALVVALAGAKAGYRDLLRTLAGVVALVSFLILVLKPAYAWLLRKYAPDGELSPTILATLVIGLLACAMATESLHLHAMFGAFLFGACLPRDDGLLRSVAQRIEPISIAVLMPLFFALAGLGTTRHVFSNGGLQPMIVVVVIASVGKIAGGAFGARIAGYDWRESMATGSLMNSRGLMELIVMKIGLDVGLIGAEMFTILMVMALLTTAMTGPLITMFLGRNARYRVSSKDTAAPALRARSVVSRR